MTRRERTETLTWSGAINPIADDIVPDTDIEISMTGVRAISVQLVTPTVAAGSATFDLHTIGSNLTGTFSATHFQDGVISAQAKDTTSGAIALNTGPHYLKLRLDLNVAVTAAGEDVVAYVWIDYEE